MNLFLILKKIIKINILSLKFFFNKEKDEILLASVPRSGAYLTIGLLNVCYSIQKGLPGTLGVSDEYYRSFLNMNMSFDERSIFLNYSFPHLWHTHQPYSQLTPLRKKFCKTIVIIREPVSGIKSWILLELTGKKIDHNLNKAFTLEDFLKIDKKLKFISSYNDFYISWLKKKNTDNIERVVVIDHETIKKDLAQYLDYINNFFSFNFSSSSKQEALKQLDLKNILSSSSANSQRVSNRNFSISKELEKYIEEKCMENYLNILNHQKKF